MVRAKFFVAKKQDLGNGKVQLEMNAVYEGSAENKEFWEWTPAGFFQMSTINAKAAEYFEQGKEYYIDITRADGS